MVYPFAGRPPQAPTGISVSPPRNINGFRVAAFLQKMHELRMKLRPAAGKEIVQSLHLVGDDRAIRPFDAGQQ